MKTSVICILMPLFCGQAPGQPATQKISINIFPGDIRCNGAQQSDPAWNQNAPDGRVQVGTKMSCTVPIPQSQTNEYVVSIIGFEPLATATQGMRVFDIIVNGEKKTGVDYFRYAGPRQNYEVGFRIVALNSITINFESTSRTAIWSKITVQQIVQNIMTIIPFAPPPTPVK